MKQKQKHNMCEIRIQQDFIAKKKNKQGYDKKNVPKINVEQTKSNGELNLYLYTFGT